MEVPESPETVFSLLFSRLSSGKHVIFYDNACNLHDYCIKREPEFFKDTLFFSDRFHQPDHTRCSTGYDINSFGWGKFINTQVAEIGNSPISKFKTQTTFMTIDHFYLYMRFWSVGYNRRVKHNLMEKLNKNRKYKTDLKTLHKSLHFVMKYYFEAVDTAPCGCHICTQIYL